MDGLGLDTGYEIVLRKRGCFHGDRRSLSSVCKALESPSQKGVKCSLTLGQVALDNHVWKEVCKCPFRLLFLWSADTDERPRGQAPSEALDRAQPQFTGVPRPVGKADQKVVI